MLTERRRRYCLRLPELLVQMFTLQGLPVTGTPNTRDGVLGGCKQYLHLGTTLPDSILGAYIDWGVASSTRMEIRGYSAMSTPPILLFTIKLVGYIYNLTTGTGSYLKWGGGRDLKSRYITCKRPDGRWKID